MKTFQDFENAENKYKFIADLIEEFKSSDLYKEGIEARKYYRGENTKILSRKPYFYSSEGMLREDVYKANNQIPTNFLKKIINQQTSYLFSNGVTVNDKIKDKLDRKLDLKLQDLGDNAQLDGVSWAYVYLDTNRLNIAVWKGIEFIPLYDERTSQLRAGIRFWEIDPDKPTFVELYEEDGKTDLEIKKGKMNEITSKVAYKIKKRADKISEVIVGEENWSKLPILKLPANEYEGSAFNVAFKNQNDLYDIVESDFGNNLEDTNDIYWVLKNYQGQDFGEFLASYKEYKMVQVDDDGDARAERIDVPYQAREVALKILEENILKNAMALDTAQLAGSALTATAIKSLFVNLDLKTDRLERYAIEFMEDLISFSNEQFSTEEDYEIQFIRRTLINDTEVIQNVINSYTAGIMSKETAIEKNPYIEDALKELERLQDEEMDNIDIEEPIEEGSTNSDEEVEEKVEAVANKTLNGAQTQSLLEIMERFSDEKISLNQAVNLVVVSIGVSKEEAKRIIEGLD